MAESLSNIVESSARGGMFLFIEYLEKIFLSLYVLTNLYARLGSVVHWSSF